MKRILHLPIKKFLDRCNRMVTLIAAISLPASSAFADEAPEAEPRPVSGVYGIEAGGISAYSTYLSPLTYTGASYGIFGNWRKALPFAPEEAIMEFDTRLDFGSMLNPRHTARMLDAEIYFSWGMAWRKRLPCSIQISAGGDIAADCGLLWLTRNGNNPIAARAYASIALKAGATWRFKIGRLPMLLSEDFRLPVSGVFFSPSYGETYYEIYLGNRSGLAHFGWPGNHLTLSNHIFLTLDFGRTAMSVGYRFAADTSWINHIDTRILSHTFTIGVIPGGLGMKNNKRSNYAWY